MSKTIIELCVFGKPKTFVIYGYIPNRIIVMLHLLHKKNFLLYLMLLFEKFVFQKEIAMKIIPIGKSYDYKDAKKDRPSFGKFIKFELYSGFADGPFHTSKSTINNAVEEMTDIVKTLKEIVGDKLNFYRRKPKDFHFYGKSQYAPEIAARTLFIEDNNGKNSGELKQVIDHLLDCDANFKVYSNDLFEPKPKSSIWNRSESVLEAVAQYAKPEDLIKL